nr:DsrE family protein [Candidatus Sigynarchaeota archaeon]
AAMDIETKLVFTKDAVYSLLKGQDTAAIGMPGLDAGFDILRMSSVPVLAIIEDMEERDIRQGDLIAYPGLEMIHRDDFARLVAESTCSFRL